MIELVSDTAEFMVSVLLELEARVVLRLTGSFGGGSVGTGGGSMVPE